MGVIYRGGVLYGGGTEGENIIYLTKAEYDAITPTPGQLYGITDWSPEAISVIKDTIVADNSTWSSSKISQELNAKALSNLNDVELASPTDGQILEYDLAASKWKNKTVSANVTSYSNTSSGLAANSVQSAIDEVAGEIGDVETLLAAL